jgi:leader peptidase (prepilin peptidase)/N-methyltransferase
VFLFTGVLRQVGAVVVPDWIVYTFLFALGCCIGSFLNVVIYRLPREKSIVCPPSACPSCGRLIRFYDNIPLISWLLLGRKCRYCKAPISPRYFIIEMLTGMVFLGLFILYFRVDMRSGMVPFLKGGWLIYIVHVILLSAFITASAVDLELWVIPITICWFAAAVGLLGSAVAGYVMQPNFMFFPSTATFFFKEVTVASIAGGAAVGFVISMFLLLTGLIKQSYEEEAEDSNTENEENEADNFNHRREICKEILFLLPIIICVVVSLLLSRNLDAVRVFWLNLTQYPLASGLIGSLFGYFVGCAVVWATRILGTLGFGREAMGLGDVHLMGAAGAVVGPLFVVIAFFVAPFFGLVWACFQMFFKKTRQIPYGPFLSLGVFTVMILHDSIVRYVNFLKFR